MCICRESLYDPEQSTMFDNPTYATINDYQLSYNPERSTMLDNPTYATINEYQVSYNPERSTMLDNPAYSTVVEYQRSFNPERASEMMENRSSFALNQHQLQVVMTGNPAYGTVLKYNPACLVVNRLIISLNSSNEIHNCFDINYCFYFFSGLTVHLEEKTILQLLHMYEIFSNAQ